MKKYRLKNSAGKRITFVGERLAVARHSWRDSGPFYEVNIYMTMDVHWIYHSQFRESWKHGDEFTICRFETFEELLKRIEESYFAEQLKEQLTKTEDDMHNEQLENVWQDLWTTLNKLKHKQATSNIALACRHVELAKHWIEQELADEKIKHAMEVL